MTADLPPAARAERQAILDHHGIGTIVESPDADMCIVRAPSCESAAAIAEWSGKWDVEQFGILRPYKIECSSAGHLSYYHLIVPQLEDSAQ
jgi:hypothetical protein